MEMQGSFILLHTISSSIPWVRKLVTLCNQIPVTPSNVARLILENELCKIIDDMFGRFDWDPIGSALIAKVHQARLKGDKKDVVKVQHPWLQGLMMSDLRNLQAFALCVQKTDTKFDLFSACKEMGKQIVLLQEKRMLWIELQVFRVKIKKNLC